MARLARVIAVNIPHHVTQRGNARQFILASDAESTVYLDLLRKYAEAHYLTVLGYCPMSNHVHLIVIPRKPKTRFAGARSQRHSRTLCHILERPKWLIRPRVAGPVLFLSADSAHLWAALRYTELNPVRAGMVAEPETYAWSSAGAHCGQTAPESILEITMCQQNWNHVTWRQYLTQSTAAENESIRRSTHTGRPLGTLEFIKALEKEMRRDLSPKKGGRPEKSVGDTDQGEFTF